MYVITTLFTQLHSYMFQLSRGRSYGVLMRFVSRVYQICAQI
jgi:hypothetical protein